MKFNEAQKIVDFVKRAEKEINAFYEIAGTEAINFYTRNFAKHGFDDDGIKPWKPRARERVRDRGRAILVKKGALRRSLIKRPAGKLAVYIISPLPYAKLMNDGGDINKADHSRSKTIKAKVRGNSGFVNGKFTKGRSRAVKLKGEEYAVAGHKAHYPARPFIGESKNLSKKILSRLDKRIKAAFK